MVVSDKGLFFCAQFEGLSLTPYLCPAKVPTIGYGTTFYEDGTKVRLSDPAITKERALQLLRYHMNHFAQTVDSYTTDAVNQQQFDALVDFAYNLGTNALKGSTLLKKVNLNPSDPAIPVEFSRWVNAGGKRLAGLVRRRAAESILYTTGSYGVL